MLALLAVAFLQTAEADPAPPRPPEVQAERAPTPVRPVRAPPAPPAPAGREITVVKVVAIGDVLRGDWPATPSGKRVTIDESSSVDDTVQTIAEAAGWSAVLNTGRVGERQLVLKLKDVPVEEALRAALYGTGLVATRTGIVVVVSPGISPVTERPVLSGFDKPSGRRFSGELDDVDGREALLRIGKAAGISITLPSGQLGKVTAIFKDVPVEEALKSVLEQAGLEAAREGSVVTVRRREEGLPGRFEFHGELGPEIGRTVQEAMRGAQRELKRAQREAKATTRGSRRDRERVGGDVVVEAGEEARDVHSVGGNVLLKPGAEAREVVAVGGNVTLEAGASARQAVAVGGDVNVGPGASVEKDAVSVGGKVQVDPSGDIGGQRVAVTVPGFASMLGTLSDRFVERHTHSAAWSFAGLLVRYALYFGLGILLVLIFPRRVDVIAASVVSNPVKALLAGLLGLMAQPFLAILLVVTLIGIPLVLVQVLGMILAGVFGFTAVALYLGRALPLPLDRRTPILQLAVGMALLVVATHLPFLGWVVWIVLVMLTFGAVLRTRFGQEPVLATATIGPPPPPPPAAGPPQDAPPQPPPDAVAP